MANISLDQGKEMIPLSPENQALFLEYFDGVEDHLLALLDTKGYSPLSTKRILESLLEGQELNEDLVYLCRDTKTGIWEGLVALLGQNPYTGRARVFLLAQEGQIRSKALAVYLKHLVIFGFKKLALRRLSAVSASSQTNTVLKSFGFQEEGQFKEWGRGKDGELVDLILWRCLRSECLVLG
jgi:hypothetical protein